MLGSLNSLRSLKLHHKTNSQPTEYFKGLCWQSKEVQGKAFLFHFFWPWALVRSILCQSYRLLNLSETAAVDDAATRSVWPRSSPCPNGALGRSHPRHPSQIRRRLGTRPRCSLESESLSAHVPSDDLGKCLGHDEIWNSCPSQVYVTLWILSS